MSPDTGMESTREVQLPVSLRKEVIKKSSESPGPVETSKGTNQLSSKELDKIMAGMEVDQDATVNQPLGQKNKEVREEIIKDIPQKENFEGTVVVGLTKEVSQEENDSEITVEEPINKNRRESLLSAETDVLTPPDFAPEGVSGMYVDTDFGIASIDINGNREIADYNAHKPIGSGGFGRVFFADTNAGTRMVIKEVRKRAEGESNKKGEPIRMTPDQIYVEINNHKIFEDIEGIPKVLGVTETEGEAYIGMERAGDADMEKATKIEKRILERGIDQDMSKSVLYTSGDIATREAVADPSSYEGELYTVTGKTSDQDRDVFINEAEERLSMSYSDILTIDNFIAADFHKGEKQKELDSLTSQILAAEMSGDADLSDSLVEKQSEGKKALREIERQENKDKEPYLRLVDRRMIESGRFQNMFTQMKRTFDAAAEMHKLGYVHRDIKRANIMTDSEKNNQTSLIDLGTVAKDSEVFLTFDTAFSPPHFDRLNLIAVQDNNISKNLQLNASTDVRSLVLIALNEFTAQHTEGKKYQTVSLASFKGNKETKALLEPLNKKNVEFNNHVIKESWAQVPHMPDELLTFFYLGDPENGLGDKIDQASTAEGSDAVGEAVFGDRPDIEKSYALLEAFFSKYHIDKSDEKYTVEGEFNNTLYEADLEAILDNVAEFRNRVNIVNDEPSRKSIAYLFDMQYTAN